MRSVTREVQPRPGTRTPSPPAHSAQAGRSHDALPRQLVRASSTSPSATSSTTAGRSGSCLTAPRRPLPTVSTTSGSRVAPRAQLSAEVADRGSDRIARTVVGTSPGLTSGPMTVPRGAASTTPPQPTPDSTHATSPSPPPRVRALHGGSTATPRPGPSTSTDPGSSRAGTLRGVQVATELGYTSLVVTYRNTAEGPRVGTGRSTLGHTEKRGR